MFKTLLQRRGSIVLSLTAFGLAACSSGGAGSTSASAADTAAAAEETVVDNVTASDADDNSRSVIDNGFTSGDLSHWIINTTDRSRWIFESASSSLGVVEDVQLAELQSIDNIEYVLVETSGIPNYDVLMTQELVNTLNARPLASRDFGAGVTTTTAGQVVEFGENIGFNSSTSNCPDTGGDGYWPPGPECPTDMARSEYFAVTPSPALDECETGLGTTGLMVNGAAIFNWGDGMSYGNGVWYNLAPVAEQYDVDICGGHAAQGEYHHHFYTSCLAELVADDGSAHSPIYGFAADGYPLFGPWETSGTLALSAWKIRDYGANADEGGCATPGERSCVLTDEFDLSKGVTSVTAGPDIGATVSTLSGNSLAADAGYYYEDYYYAGADAVGPQLDQFNGHDNDDGRGYHYHITLTKDDQGDLQPAFPYTIGPRFYGELPANALSNCGGATGGGPPPFAM